MTQFDIPCFSDDCDHLPSALLGVVTRRLPGNFPLQAPKPLFAEGGNLAIPLIRRNPGGVTFIHIFLVFRPWN
jgi:hypothetical protein